MNDDLYEFLLKLPRKNLIHLMIDAIGEMQHWNGNTRMHCIMNALAADQIDDKTWKLPSLKDAKEYTKDCPL